MKINQSSYGISGSNHKNDNHEEKKKVQLQRRGEIERVELTIVAKAAEERESGERKRERAAQSRLRVYYEGWKNE